MDARPGLEAAAGDLWLDQISGDYMKNYALIIFVRNPVLGKVKTRIAATIGDENALAIYKHLLQFTKQIVSSVDVTKHIFYADELNQNDLWDGNEKYQQTGVDLGDKMKNAFNCVFANGYSKVIIIGSDCFELTSDILKSSFDKLDGSDIVIGPAKDGGYYLLGMGKPYLYLFDNIQWSTNRVFNETLEIMKENNLSFDLLPELNDIDEARDITFTY